ncbi:lysis system i-spanin subunit Rz [Pseudomonas kribbensis]|uniref:lysis system i-spanin subunit Rz n=1 Tax=Pseudomonas kribbensis TaxID=1628086 RepID=UPI001F464F66|nr:lysis system i-spanin subunit Rz [Pseudomonas kribbensis]UIN53633.1 lysis protein [Pseudomonas kribbensis]
MTVPWRLIGVVMLGMTAGVVAWQVQDWRYGEQLADQSRLHTETLNQLTMAAAAAHQAEQDKRLALEQRLAASDKTHSEKMTNAQKDQALLRDRLATSDLRLSVLIDSASAGGCSVPAATGAGGVVHADVRAELDPAHAQRIIAITDEGDRGLIALQACQAYIRTLTH